MNRLPEAMPKTISTIDRVRRSACLPDARRKTGDLLQVLAAVECHFTVSGPAGVPATLLRDLVIVANGLAGRTWLEANSDRAAAFAALRLTAAPPPLPELDRILADVLSSRFHLAAEPAAT